MGQPKPKVFLDTSAVFAGIWSTHGGAFAILRLGEEKLIETVVCTAVLKELDVVLREKLPGKLNMALQMLDICISHIAGEASHDSLSTAHSLIAYPPDAFVVASALRANVDYFVTLDKKHLLSNAALHAAALFPIGTPGDFLAWYRNRLNHGN